MLLSTLVKTVKRKSHRGDQTVTTDLITQDIIACANEAIRDIQKLLPKRFWYSQGTIAVTVGAIGTPAVYSLPSDTQEPIVFHYTSGTLRRLTKIQDDREWIDTIWNPTGPVGLPTHYRELGPNSSTGYKQIELYPIPSSTLTLNVEYYKVKGSDLTTSDLSSEIPNIPDHVQDVVEKGAYYYFLKGFDDPMQGVAKSDYEESKRALDVSDDRDLDLDIALDFKPRRIGKVILGGGGASIDPSTIFNSSTYAELKALAVQYPTQQRWGWATDILQLVFYTANTSIGDAGWIVVAG